VVNEEIPGRNKSMTSVTPCPRIRNLFVQRSFSVLLPVKDAQATLSQSVHAILDEMVDSRQPFELLIIDDGSTDATNEVAHELTSHYPQVRLIRHGASCGREASIRTGIERSRGDVVMLRDDERGFRILERPSRSAASVASRPAAPNYLSRLKKFVVSE
jgi:glycosyltransferase involved in cell wall biosynthesis